MSMFHPFEIAICGYSGSGKTTLATRLIEYFATNYRVGYIKHSGHDFAMDRTGKDTDLRRCRTRLYYQRPENGCDNGIGRRLRAAAHDV